MMVDARSKLSPPSSKSPAAFILTTIAAGYLYHSSSIVHAAGGIPQLVKLLETGSQKAREEAAHILWNLCCHSEDIRASLMSAMAEASCPLGPPVFKSHKNAGMAPALSTNAVSRRTSKTEMDKERKRTLKEGEKKSLNGAVLTLLQKTFLQ